MRLRAVLSIVLYLLQLKSGRFQSRGSTQLESDDADPEREESKAHIPIPEETPSLNEDLSEGQKMSSESGRILNKNQNIFYFPLTGSLSLSEQLRSHIGSRRGTIGTEHVPVISPPKDVRVKSNHTKSYHKEDKVCEKRNLEDEHYITQKMLQFHAFVEALKDAYATSQDPLATLIHPFLTTLPEARMQFITHFCLQRQYFASVADYAVRNWALQPDYFQFCPKVCGKREDPSLQGDPRIMLNRYSIPCNHPSAYSTYVSRICLHPNTSHFGHQELFQCECLPDSSWMEHSKVCAFVVKPSDIDCDPKGTKHVGYVGIDKDQGGELSYGGHLQAARCVCKPNYYGTKCDKLKNPCTMSIGDALPGNVACAVSKGNICYPVTNLSRYVCECISGYDRIPTTEFPPGRLLDNCLREMDPCAVKACVHGTCVLTDRGTILEQKGRQQREPFMWIGRTPAVQARCVCNEGWTGEQCAHPLVRNAWTPWSPWSICEPACQTSFRQLPPTATRELVPISENTPKWGMRQRTRFRDCVGGSSDCRQEMLVRSADMELSIEDGESLRQFERRACRPRPCDRHLVLSTRKRSMKQSGVQKQVRDTLRQANTVHLWTLLAFTFTFAIFGVFAAFATKMHHEKVYELPPVNRPRKPRRPQTP